MRVGTPVPEALCSPTSGCSRSVPANAERFCRPMARKMRAGRAGSAPAAVARSGTWVQRSPSPAAQGARSGGYDAFAILVAKGLNTDNLHAEVYF